MPYTNHQYVKLELYDKPAWDATATLEETLTNLTEISGTINQGLSPDSVSFSIKNDGTDCDYAGKGIKVILCCDEILTDGYGNILSNETYEKEVYKGFIQEKFEIRNAVSKTHVGWNFTCENVLATWEAFEFDLSLDDGTGISNADLPSVLPPKFVDFGGQLVPMVKKYIVAGNALRHFEEIRKQNGHIISGRGDMDGLDPETDGVQVIQSGESVPECEGVKFTYRMNNNTGATAQTIKTQFMAKSQQWWIPIAWSEEDETSGEWSIHVIYRTDIQHPRVQVDSSMTSPYTALYFDDADTTFSVIDQADLVSSTTVVADYDYTTLGDVTLVQPTDASIYTGIMIHKSYTLSSAPESEEKTSASILAKFKTELPDVMSIHIQTTAAIDKYELEEYGSAPYYEEDVGYVKKGNSITITVPDSVTGTRNENVSDNIGKYAIERLAEMQFVNEKVYNYTFGLTHKVPLPSFGNERGGDLVQGSPLVMDNKFVYSTTFSWSGDAIDITVTVREWSEKTAAYLRVSKYNLPRYFKKQLRTKLNKVSDADYAKIEGNKIIFRIDGEDVEISLTDNILTDDGIVKW
jgi:hypothetical protein